MQKILEKLSCGVTGFKSQYLCKFYFNFISMWHVAIYRLGIKGTLQQICVVLSQVTDSIVKQ